MKKILVCLLLFTAVILPSTGSAQSIAPGVISSAGGSVGEQGATLNWTLGEMAVETRTSPVLMLTEGFQQPALHIVSTDDPVLPFSIILYPNPAKTRVMVQFDGLNQPVVLHLYNLLGELISEQDVEAGHTIAVVSMASRSNGLYMLVILSRSGERLTQYKIIKAE